MTTSKLIDRFRNFLDLDRRKQQKKRDEIRELLKKLKKRQRQLEEKLESETGGHKRKRIKRDLKVLYTQRKKGVKLCREIKCKK